jgi:hypothetical protein
MLMVVCVPTSLGISADVWVDADAVRGTGKGLASPTIFPTTVRGN